MSCAFQFPTLRIPSFSIGFIRVGAGREFFRIRNPVPFSFHPLFHKVSGRFFDVGILENFVGIPTLRIPSFSIGFIRVGAGRGFFRILHSVPFSFLTLFHKVSEGFFDVGFLGNFVGIPTLRIPSFSIGFIRVGAGREFF